MTKRTFWLFFALIVLLAAALRLYKLGQIPVALYWDEVAMMIDARSIAETGKDMHGRPWFQILYPSYGDYKQPVYIWLAAVSFKIFGASEWALRLPSALAGVGTVIVSGLVARRLITTPIEKYRGQLLQLVTMVVVAIAPWSLMFSRAAFEGHIGQFLLASSLLLLTFQKKRTFWLFGSVLLAALATYTYFSVRFVWPLVCIVYQLSELDWSKTQWRSHLGVSLLLPLIMYGLLLWPMFNSPFYAASNQFRLSTDSIFNSHDYPLQSNMYRELAGNTMVDRIFFHRHVLLLQQLAINLADNFSLDFLFLTGDPNLRHGTGSHGLFLLPLLPFFLIGMYRLFDAHKKVLLLLAVWSVAAALPASVPEDTPHALRFLNALVPLSLIIGVGLTQLRSRYLSIVTSIVIGFFLLQFIHYYFLIYPTHSADRWLTGYKEAALSYDEKKDRVFEFYWELADDKFYLWLLAYGDLSSEQIQQLKTNSFLVDVTQFEKYRQEVFAGYDQPGADGQKVIIVAEAERVPQLEKQPFTLVTHVQPLGKGSLVVIELERTNE